MGLFSYFTGTRPRLKKLAVHDVVKLVATLEQTPAQAAFVLGWLERFGMSGQKHNAFFDFFVVEENEAWSMIALVVHQNLIAFVKGSYEHGAELGQYLLRRRQSEVHTVLGAHDAVDGLTDQILPEEQEPRMRKAQILMLKTPTAHDRPAECRFALERPLLEDAYNLGIAAQKMYEEEIGIINTTAENEALIELTLLKVHEQRLWFLPGNNREVLFQASTTPPTRCVSQIEGVWTDPSVRGRGVAESCLQDICVELFTLSSHISLVVNDDNHVARRLYHRLGFVEVDDWATIYID